jgi:hypothetical protein
MARISARQTLTFDTRALNDGRLRVRLKNAAGSFFTLLDWDTPTSTNWLSRSCSLAAYTGQTVTLYFEQNDGGQKNLETRYIDNVVVHTSDAEPLYAPLAPKLFTPIANLTNGVSLRWRPNGNSAAQYAIERRAGASTNWQLAATILGTATNLVDAATSWGTNLSYRVRGINAAGSGAYSSERDVITPPKPSLTIFAQTNKVILTWPAWATNYQLQTSTNLAAGIWAVQSGTAANNGSEPSFTLSPTNNSRYFRLQLQ